ncbi:MAG: glucans biosynthesis glucosyltransferase MdoH [Pseudomonadota bacterium]
MRPRRSLSMLSSDLLHQPDIRANLDARQLFWRRCAITLLVISSIGLLAFWMGYLLFADGFSVAGLIMLTAFMVTLPYLALTFWSSVAGFVILRFSRDPVALVLPAAARADMNVTSRSRTAIVMPTRNEDPAEVIRRLGAMASWLDSDTPDEHYEFFILSDTQDAAIARQEEEAFAAWQEGAIRPERLHYRRRTSNEGFKAGNVREFMERHGDRFDFMLVLDSDSVMSAHAIRRLVSIMDADNKIGILQPLIVGLPSASPFARIFQYGMRHGMRVFATGSAWWQGDEGPYWGHNALIRIAPFRDHCHLPRIPDNRFLGGQILSHDQVEAVLMRRAGYECRVIPLEDGSYEDNPPTLPDFLARDLRWCQGNMQYVHLLGLSGARLIGRQQLLFAILMYLGAPCWMLFLGIGLGHAITGAPLFAGSIDPLLGLALFGVMMTMTFGPKLLGIIDVLSDKAKRTAFGGTGTVLKGAGFDLLFGFLAGPVLALTHALFIIGLFFGRTVQWTAQQRQGRMVGVMEALQNLWPHTLLGVGATLALAWSAPNVLPWALPVLIGMMLAVPFACFTTHAAFGRWLERNRCCATPEEIAPPPSFGRLGIADRNQTAVVTKPVIGEMAPATTS